MNQNLYQYLFPFEKVPFRSRIIIYGAGTLGQDYLYQIQLTHYCDVVAVADRNYMQYPPMVVPIIPPGEIHKFQFDYVVIALRMASALNEVKRILVEEGVSESQIICIFERTELPEPVFEEYAGALVLREEELAFSRVPVSIALLVTGGFGDMVIQKRLIMEIIKMAPGCMIDFYNIKAIDFLEYLYLDCKNINQVIPDLGSRYRENSSKYTLALTVEACHFIKVDEWKREKFGLDGSQEYQEFVKRVDRLKQETDMEGVGISTPAHLTLARRAYQGLNAYSGFNYNGAFHIEDCNVSIPLDKKWEQTFLKMNFGKYITVNLGNGDCADNGKIAKSWDKRAFEKLIFCIKTQYPGIHIVQIGAKNAQRITGATQYVLGADFRLAAYILKNSILHIDIEGGLVHIATQLGTKCVVLFGPTVKEYYGYPQNINIQAGSCHNCWGLYSDVNRCARGMEKPECMCSITPELVMERIREYVDKIFGEEHGHEK